MSLGSALADLRVAHAILRDAVQELVMTVHEDRPLGSDVAAIDHLAEVVSELEGCVMQAGQELDTVRDPRGLPLRLPAVDAALAAAQSRYWRDLRAHAPVTELRLVSRGRGEEWRTWQLSLELTQLRCEVPLVRAAETVRLAWREVGELLGLHLPTIAHPPDPRDPVMAESVADPTTRRPQ
jgi:hypothetical protein